MIAIRVALCATRQDAAPHVAFVAPVDLASTLENASPIAKGFQTLNPSIRCGYLCRIPPNQSVPASQDMEEHLDLSCQYAFHRAKGTVRFQFSV